MALSGFLSDIIKFIIFLVLLSIVGWVITESGVLGNYPPINASFVYQVQVLDHNGSPVPDQKVYFLSCLQEPAGWFTPASYTNSSGTYGYTDKNGMVELDSINYTVHKNESYGWGPAKMKPSWNPIIIIRP